MELNILEEMESVMTIDDECSKELNVIFDKMWKYSGRDYLIVYHPEGIHLFKVHTFNNLLNLLGLNGPIKEAYIHPIIIFAVLGSNIGALGYDRKYPIEFRPHNDLVVNKINLNKYQDWFIKNKQVTTKLKLPTDLTVGVPLIFTEMLNERHPQLRRILKEYFILIDQKFDEGLLYTSLKKLLGININKTEYSYLDADEVFLYNEEWYSGTYFEQVPIELKKIIIENIDRNKYLSREVIFAKDEPIIKAIENIVDTIKETDDASIFDIIGKVSNEGYLDELFTQIRTTPQADQSMYRYITSGVGMNTIKDIVTNKLNRK